jgi:cytochrome c oxidase cbb3-type subunit 3
MTDEPKNLDKKQVDRLRPHSFDGIQEYDNSLPKWWLYLFYVTIAFTPIYLVYYHVANAPGLQDELKADMDLMQTQMQVNASASSATDLVQLSQNAEIVASGRAEYAITCAPCHGEQGQGVIGPNLTDAFWIHGSSAEAVHKSIAEGIVEKGMPAWLQVLGHDKVNAITAFVLSIKNTKIAGGKEPQGAEEP